jgi:hypothetical protein
MKDDRDILDILKSELDFLDKGGYGRSVRTPRLPASIFQDSPSCVCFPFHMHDNDCALMEFVPPESRSESVPCHFIPLNRAGKTAAMLEAHDDQQRLEEVTKEWLSARIKQIEQARAAQVHLDVTESTKTCDAGHRF